MRHFWHLLRKCRDVRLRFDFPRRHIWETGDLSQHVHLFPLLSRSHSWNNKDFMLFLFLTSPFLESSSTSKSSRISAYCLCACVRACMHACMRTWVCVCVCVRRFLSLKATGHITDPQHCNSTAIVCNQQRRETEREISKTYCLQSTEHTHTHTHTHTHRWCNLDSRVNSSGNACLDVCRCEMFVCMSVSVSRVCCFIHAVLGCIYFCICNTSSAIENLIIGMI